jgi:hypothetical protein
MNQCKLQITDTFDVVGTQRLYNIKKIWQYLLQQGKMIYGSSFVISKTQKTAFYKLVVYAIEDQKEMAKFDLDPKKGILLMGQPNTGKTAMLRLIKPFFARKRQYEIKTCRVLSQEFSHKGFEMTESLLAPNAKGILLDNLGREMIAKHYGYSCDIIYNIVEHFYEQRHDLPFPKLHITTTLSPTEIERKYGVGFRKMLTELFNVIVCE